MKEKIKNLLYKLLVFHLGKIVRKPLILQKQTPYFKIFLDLSKRNNRRIFFKRIYEKSTFKIIKKILRTGEYAFIDGGAHVGYFTKAALSFSKNPIIAVEPSHDNFPLLSMNAQGATLYQAALSDKDGVAIFYESSESDGGHSIKPAFNVKESYQIKTITLDTILKENKIFDYVLIKLDIQYAEPQALSSLTPTEHMLIILEVFENRDEILAWAQKHALSTFKITGQGLVRDQEMKQDANYFLATDSEVKRIFGI